MQTIEKGSPPLYTGALADQFLRASLAQQGGGVILGVGNSSSLGDGASNLQQIYLRLGGTGQRPRYYDDFFIITVSDQGATNSRRLKYGAPAR